MTTGGSEVAAFSVRQIPGERPPSALFRRRRTRLAGVAKNIIVCRRDGRHRRDARLRASRYIPMMPPVELGEKEYAVWRVVYRLGRCSVRQVHEAVGVPREVAYTTVATMLDRLFAKRVVHRERDGRSFWYWVSRRAVPSKRVPGRTLVARILGNGATSAIATLVDAVEAVDPALLDKLVAEIAARRRRGNDEP